MDLATISMMILAALFSLIAYYKAPDLPLAGLKVSWQMFQTIGPRLLLALIVTGMLQVIIPQEVVSRWIGREAGIRGILIASLAGVLTPGGPMVSIPFVVVLYQSGAALAPLVAYITSWSLFGFQRILAWELPLLGEHFVVVRIVSSAALPIVAGLIVKLYLHE